jgi:GPH family glycoside/pentoside/hexuronide:cation symporter
MNEDKEYLEKTFNRPDKKREIYFSLSSFFGILMFGLWGQIQFFSVAVILIPILWIPIMYLVYSIVDGFNDPILGYLTDRSTRFVEKYGKRYPWIMIGAIFGPIPLLLIFIPIYTSVLIAAIWITIMMCVYETFATLREISHQSLFPDLFRHDDQRASVSGITMLITVIAQIFGAITIPLIIAGLGGVTNPTAFLGAAIFITIISYFLILPYSRGVKETDEMKQLRLQLDEKIKEHDPVTKVIKRVFRDRNWLAIILAFLAWATAGLCFSAGLSFFVLHGLGLGIEVMVLPSLLALVFALISVPFWVKIPRKIGVKNSYLAALGASAIIFFAFFFVTDYIGVVIVYGLAGIMFSACWGIIFNLVQAEAIDNAAAKTGKREEGSYIGILRVFSAFSYFFQTLIFALAWGFFGYEPAKGPNQTDFAKFGLKFSMSIIPLIIMTVGIVIFALLYQINREDVMENKRKLLEMGI